MPDLTKTVEIILQGTDNISDVLTNAGKNMDRFGDDLQDIGQPFSDASDKVALLNTAIAGLAIAGLKASSDIESQAQKMKNSLGLPTEEAKKFKDVALDVYSTGYVDNLADAFDVVTAAQKKFGDNASVDIGKVSEQALALQKTFGTDFNESIAAVGTLMSDFGITSEEAFNFITAGFQEGLNGSDDFLESITEYSTQFKNGGADAGEFFSVLSSGFQDGVLGTDKAADMFKEFRVRIQDESKSTNEALQSLGIDPEEFGENMASGKTTAAEAFSFIQERLNETQDKTVQFNAGVALMGTQFEDMGTAAALAVKTTSVNLDDLQGKIDSIDTRTFAEKFQALTNTITSQFGNMERWEVAKEKIGVVFEDIAASFGPALKNVDFSGLEESAEQVWNKISNIFKNNDIDLTTVHGMENAVQLAIGVLCHDGIGTPIQWT